MQDFNSTTSNLANKNKKEDPSPYFGIDTNLKVPCCSKKGGPIPSIWYQYQLDFLKFEKKDTHQEKLTFFSKKLFVEKIFIGTMNRNIYQPSWHITLF